MPGLVVIATLTVVAPMLGMLGVDEVTKWLGTFFGGVVLAIIGVRALKIGVGIFGMIVLMLPGLVSLWLIEGPLLGGIAQRPVDQASDAWWAAGFRFTDSTLRFDMKTTVVLAPGGRGRRQPMRPTSSHRLSHLAGRRPSQCTCGS